MADTGQKPGAAHCGQADCQRRARSSPACTISPWRLGLAIARRSLSSHTTPCSDWAWAASNAARSAGQLFTPLMARGSLSPLGRTTSQCRGKPASCASRSALRQSLAWPVWLQAGPWARPTTSTPSTSSTATSSSTFQGNRPLSGSGMKAPSLASPLGQPARAMPVRALVRAASSWLPGRSTSRVKLPRLSVSKPSTRSTAQPSD